MKSLRLLLALSTLTAFASACPDEPLAPVAPKIEIGDSLSETASVCEIDGIENCSYDFGDVAIGEGRLFRFLIKNPSPIDLYITDISFDTSSDPSFTLQGELPTAVYATTGEEGAEVVVQFSPRVAGPVSGKLIISSDAVNLAEGANVEIDFTGSGNDLGSPSMTINPSECDFGDVGVGVTAFCDLNIENTGNRDLEILGVGFTDATDTGVFGSQTILPVPTFIAPGTGITVRLFAQPNAASVFTGGLIVQSSDPANAEVIIPLTVTGAVAPTAVAEVRSVNGTPVGSQVTQVEPLDDVIVTGTNSVASTAGGTITGYAWSIIEKPAESSVQLTNPNSMETGFEFSSGSGTRDGLDVAGSFVVRLEVTDDNGLTSSNDARVTLSSIPNEALHIQLTWDSPENDIDMHLSRGNGAMCNDTETCYYANCKESNFGSSADWDNGGGGSPTLDVDDLDGFGPENINIDTPLDGNYKIRVNMYSYDESTLATVKIFINGALRNEFFRDITGDDDVWSVATINWSAGAGTVTPLDSYQTDVGCDAN